MPRYYFDLANGTREPDRTGQDLPDLNAARVTAVQVAGQILHSDPERLWKGGDFRVEVTDQEGQILCTVIIVGIDMPTALKLMD